MLQIRNLNIVHKKDLHTILENFSFVLNPGDRAVIIGEEGNGKSTLLKWLADPETVEAYAEVTGERICTGERLGYLPQELSQSDKEKSVYEFFCEEPLFWDQTPGQLGALAGNLRVTPDFFFWEQRMHTLSGGEKIKAQLARIWMARPTVLLLDEPSNDIDIETLEWLESMLLKAHQPVLYVSHDETLIEKTANVIIHIEQLRRKTVSRYTVAHTSYRAYLRQRSAQLESQRREAQNERRQEKRRQEKYQRLQQKVENAQNAVSRQDPHAGQLLKKKMKAVKSMERRFQREAAGMTGMPESEEAIFLKLGQDVSLPAGKTVLDFRLERLTVRDSAPEISDQVLAENISLFVKGGEKICIVGRNGAGKTTLLKKIAEELLSRTDIRACYMPQDYEELLDMDKTPVEYLVQTGDREEIARIRTYLGSMKYTAQEMEHPAAELSGGQKAKILLLKMNMSGAEVLILDEPTRNFSPLSGPVIRKALRDYGGAIISISHDRKYIEEVCGQVYRLTRHGLIKE
ncbi:MAG: ATP-binding cassette domain-containing protein [Lachnospiraceae bacterium]|nr:ATP-binding cassette domain-containing protein [Lachnospiraceae bacterium]